MNYLTLDEVYAIHLKMIEVGGGRGDIHDFTLLHSAIERLKSYLWRARAISHAMEESSGTYPFTDQKSSFR